MAIYENKKIINTIFRSILFFLVILDLYIGIPNRIDIAITGALWLLTYVWTKIPNRWATFGSFAQLLLVVGLIIVSYVNIKYDGSTMADCLGVAQLWLMCAHLANVSYKPQNHSILLGIVRLITIVIVGLNIYDCFVPFLHVSVFISLNVLIIIRIIIWLYDMIKRALKDE